MRGVEMDSILKAENWKSLTFRERIHLCREYAQEAEQLAQAAHPDRKAEYKRIAAGWHQIAAELEQFGAAKSAVPTEIGGQLHQ
jgi:hypothetical protein